MINIENITPSFFSKGEWVLSDETGHVLCEKLVLSPDHRVRGYSNPNEGGWEYEERRFYFNGRHAPSAILECDRSTSGDVIAFSGASLVVPGKILSITRKVPKIGCFLKTHFWAQTVQESYEMLEKAWGSPVEVLCDVAGASQMPAHVHPIYFNATNHQKYGLPLFPKRETAMWYNSDYPIYDLVLQTDYDAFLISEYDLAINLDLKALVGRFIEDGADFVLPWYARLHDEASWPWSAVQRSFYASETALGGRDNSNVAIFKSFFPFVFITREAALQAFASRVGNGIIFRKDPQMQWPFCESFLPTELERYGYAGRGLQQYADISKLVIDEPVHWSEVENQNLAFAHPTFSGPQFVDKIVNYANVVAKRQGINKVKWLEEQVSRLTTDEERTYLESRLKEIMPIDQHIRARFRKLLSK